MNSKGVFIDGSWRDAKGYEFQSVDPSSSEIIWSGKTASAEDVADAVSSANNAFFAWSELSVEERIVYLKKFAEISLLEKEQIAEAISKEMGKPLWESRMEAGALSSKVDVSIEAFEKRCEELRTQMGDAESVTRFKPHGVVAVFGPFNFPAHLPNGHIVPALLAGNTVVYKPSEQTPSVAEIYAELWQEAGLPAGVFNLVHGEKDTGVALVGSPDVAGVFFTGSSQTGKAIHQACAGRPDKILALEMGGNNALVAWDVADKKAAAYHIVQSAFITSGQRCVCARRLMIPNSKEGEEILSELKALTETISVGAWNNESDCFMGPVVSKAAAKSVIESQEKLISQGAKQIIACVHDEHAFVSPGILDVSEVNELADEEIFGPLLQVVRVETFQEAIDLANKTVYGLSASLLSDSSENYDTFFRQINAGIVNWNRPTTGASSKAPFGGVGESGNHRPSAYFAADYCSYPVASVEAKKLLVPEKIPPGIKLKS